MNLRTLCGYMSNPFRKRDVNIFGNLRHPGRCLFRLRTVPEMDIKVRSLHSQHSGSRRPAYCGQE